MQSLSAIGQGIGTGAQAAGQGIQAGAQAVGRAGQQFGGALKSYLGGNELAGPTPSGTPLYGGGIQQQGLLGQAIQGTPFEKAAPYLSDFLRGQGIAGSLLERGLGLQPQQYGGGGMERGLLGDVMGQILSRGAPATRVLPFQEMPTIQPKSGFIQNLISGYTGGLVGGHSGY